MLEDPEKLGADFQTCSVTRIPVGIETTSDPGLKSTQATTIIPRKSRTRTESRIGWDFVLGQKRITWSVPFKLESGEVRLAVRIETAGELGRSRSYGCPTAIPPDPSADRSIPVSLTGSPSSRVERRHSTEWHPQPYRRLRLEIQEFLSYTLEALAVDEVDLADTS